MARFSSYTLLVLAGPQRSNHKPLKPGHERVLHSRPGHLAMEFGTSRGMDYAGEVSHRERALRRDVGASMRSAGRENGMCPPGFWNSLRGIRSSASLLYQPPEYACHGAGRSSLRVGQVEATTPGVAKHGTRLAQARDA